MANFNKVILMGNLTRDPEVRYTAGGTAVASFGLAVNRRYRQGDENKEETLFIDVKAFGKQGDVLNQYLKKGSPIFLEGRLSYRKWEDQSGQTRTKIEVVMENFQFLGQGQGRGQSEAPPASGDDQSTQQFDDIPF
jgi:single-strand DNA-binding protein